MNAANSSSSGSSRPVVKLEKPATVPCDVNGYPESRLARLFNGSIPIVLDSLKQHYFIDRDGKMFRYVLSFLRTGQLLLPDNFMFMDMLWIEAKYYDIQPMLKELDKYRVDRGYSRPNSRKNNRGVTSSSADEGKSHAEQQQHGLAEDDDAACARDYECIAMHVSPDLGERITLSGERNTIEEIFPEIQQALMDGRNTGWSQDPRYVIRFPINGYCKLNSLQVFQRLFDHVFKIVASTGGGVEGQQFSEYLLSRRNVPL
ncbi:PREDICTED: BTB/POZ domain-containing protein kctd15-like [Priapulus caudatus]|uniref:BTB/POZ domain-containing protein kctd15-like n=1 Tax=Priapulus caudatus TaxID=37621 RepID=A0ABM1DQ76_PRICU|nr:PREDICTED: BTB/POZ domain-containing protein kctd15-like [Priapulus caudatus]